MLRKKTLALLCALLLPLCGCAAASEGDIVSYVQPDGVQVCALEDIVYFTAPEGLEGMYALMRSDNTAANPYVFIMPNGRALMSVACTVTAAGGTAQALLDAWSDIAAAMAAQGLNVDAQEANVRLDAQYGFDTLHISAGITAEGEPPLALLAQGVAFYRDNDLMELWTVYPKEEAYADDPKAANELTEDLRALAELTKSLDFAPSDAKPDAAFTDSVAYDDPNGLFSLRIPAGTIVVTSDTDAQTVQRERERYAAAGKGGEAVFDQWMNMVNENQSALMLMPAYGLACHISRMEGERYRSLSAADYQKLSGGLAKSLKERFGLCELMNDDTTERISGLEHALLSYWLRDAETDMVLDLFAATDDAGCMREIDLFTMVGSTVDFNTREKIMRLILQTIQYQ